MALSVAMCSGVPLSAARKYELNLGIVCYHLSLGSILLGDVVDYAPMFQILSQVEVRLWVLSELLPLLFTIEHATVL